MWNKVKKISERTGTSTTSGRQQEAQVRAWAKERKAKEETQTQATEESKENATGVKKWDTGQASAGRRLLRSKGKTNIHQVEEDDHERHEQNTCYRMFTTCNCHSHFLAISFFVSRFSLFCLRAFSCLVFSLLVFLPYFRFFSLSCFLAFFAVLAFSLSRCLSSSLSALSRFLLFLSFFVHVFLALFFSLPFLLVLSRSLSLLRFPRFPRVLAFPLLFPSSLSPFFHPSLSHFLTCSLPLFRAFSFALFLASYHMFFFSSSRPLFLSFYFFQVTP